MQPESLLYVWSETIPNWIMAIAAAGAAVVFVWRRQDRLAQQRSADDEVRLGVRAQWVKLTTASGSRAWGVLVSNTLPSDALHLRVFSTGNTRSSDGRFTCASIAARTQHFFESSSKEGAVWEFPREVLNTETITQLTRGSKSVDRVEFTYLGREFTHDGTGAALPVSAE
ncbi:hypothetical protein [Leucobacter iarius]|uniref:Uncharacterized protein n=1 Tax=Leucobacter iarius TaxID=333963 RepID=A0ABN2L9U0_9MICO